MCRSCGDDAISSAPAECGFCPSVAGTIILDVVRYVRGNGAASLASRQRHCSVTDVRFQAAEISLPRSISAHKYQLMDTCSLSDGSSFPRTVAVMKRALSWVYVMYVNPWGGVA